MMFAKPYEFSVCFFMWKSSTEEFIYQFTINLFVISQHNQILSVFNYLLLLLQRREAVVKVVKEIIRIIPIRKQKIFI